MKFLNFLSKRNSSQYLTTNNGVLGPTYFDNLTSNIDNPKALYLFEWRRQLISSLANTRFQIMYYGKLHKTHKTLIIGTEFAPALVIAKDVIGGEEIVIFDGCRFGYNAMFCDEFSLEQINNRKANNLYTDKYGNDVFEIIVSAFYQVDIEDEIKHLLNSNGLVTLLNKTKMDLQEAKRNAFDYFGIIAIIDKKRRIEILSEELA
ncbi:hypothetical protein [Foetidibacter luteolus]|uniref:hypothetical protein n=1 Tax=Foetidibacter luteolus TaxID=2608880 RepID=UPI00129AC6D2|nr:hypothetical protein [Foetidibacter luteolus]